MNVEEVERLLDHVKENNGYWFNVYQIAIHCGLRSGELYGLRWDGRFSQDSVCQVS